MNERRIAILGTVEVVGGGRTTSLAGTNLPIMLSLLALARGHPVSNERLIDILWPGADATRAGRSLISLAHQLNKTLTMHLGEPKVVVSVKSFGRALRIDPNLIDAVVFEQRHAEADAHVAAGRLLDAVEAYEAALALWRGEPFGGFDLPCFVEPATQLRLARHQCEVGLIDASLAIGRGAALLPWLLQRVEAEPFHEQLAADAARALYQAGRSTDAIRVLRTCMDELRRRRVEPRPATRQLELDVLDHSLAQVVAEGTRADTTRLGLIGRRVQREALDAWRGSAQRPPVVVITGPTGIGKTALLDTWLAASSDDLSVIRTRCSDQPESPLEVFAGLLGAGGLEPADHPGPVARHVQFDDAVRRIVDPRRPVYVVAIDDAHWLTVEAVALLRHVLWHPEVARLHVVLAVRSPDDASNTTLHRLLADLARDNRSSAMFIEPFDRDELIELIARHAGQQLAVIDPDELMRLTGGNPRLADLVLRNMVDGVRLADQRVPRAAKDLFAAQIEGLSEPSRRIIETAAVLGFDGDPSQLAGLTDASELDVMDALDDVGGGRLMIVEPIGGSYRFVHELARRAVVAGIEPARLARLQQRLLRDRRGAPVRMNR